MVLGAALGGFVGCLLRLPLNPLPRVAVALVVGACTAAATAVAVRPRQEQERQVAVAGAGAAAAGQQQQLPAAEQQHQGQQAPEEALLEARLREALRATSTAQLVKVGRGATTTLCAAVLPRTLFATTAPTHPGTCGSACCTSHDFDTPTSCSAAAGGSAPSSHGCGCTGLHTTALGSLQGAHSCSRSAVGVSASNSHGGGCTGLDTAALGRHCWADCCG